jgi:hypothetical protein
MCPYHITWMMVHQYTEFLGNKIFWSLKHASHEIDEAYLMRVCGEARIMRGIIRPSI